MPLSSSSDLQLAHALLMAGTLEGADLQVLDRGDRTGGQRRRQRRGEDEARGKRADEIAERGRRGDIAAHDAERLAERAFDDRQAVHQAFALGNAAAARTVHADGMHLVEIGHRAVLVGEIADFLDRRDIAVHRIDALEGDQLRRLRIGGGKLGFEVVEIVVPPDDALAVGIADAFDHRRMVQRVGEDDEAGDPGAERAERRPVGDIARGKDQRRFLAVQVGKLALEKNVVVGGARDIPGASRTRATVVDGVLHRLDHLGMLAHAEIVVGTPDGHFLRAVRRVARGARKIAAVTLDIGKNAVAAFLVRPVQLALKVSFKIHNALQNSRLVFLIAGLRVNPLPRRCGKRPLLLNKSKQK